MAGQGSGEAASGQAGRVQDQVAARPEVAGRHGEGAAIVRARSLKQLGNVNQVQSCTMPPLSCVFGTGSW